MNDPTAQGQQAGADGQSTQSNEGQQQQSNGVQQRIDQLVAEREAEKRARAEEREMAQRQLDAMTATIQALQRAPAVPAAEQVQVDPEIAKQFQAMMAPTVQRFENIIAQQQQVITQMQVSQVKQQLPPQVQARVNDLMMDARRRGLQGWNEMDMLKIAAGEAVLAGTWSPQAASAALNGNGQPRDERGRFGAANNGGMMQNGAPPINQQNSGPKPLPANFEQLHPQEQEKILWERIQNQPIGG